MAKQSLTEFFRKKSRESQYQNDDFDENIENQETEIDEDFQQIKDLIGLNDENEQELSARNDEAPSLPPIDQKSQDTVRNSKKPNTNFKKKFTGR